jgi:hypothetical protein
MAVRRLESRKDDEGLARTKYSMLIRLRPGGLIVPPLGTTGDPI